jgi:hypothetical protein
MLAELFMLRLTSLLRTNTEPSRLASSEARFVPIELPRK